MPPEIDRGPWPLPKIARKAVSLKTSYITSEKIIDMPGFNALDERDMIKMFGPKGIEVEAQGGGGNKYYNAMIPKKLFDFNDIAPRANIGGAPLIHLGSFTKKSEVISSMTKIVARDADIALQRLDKPVNNCEYQLGSLFSTRDEYAFLDNKEHVSMFHVYESESGSIGMNIEHNFLGSLSVYVHISLEKETADYVNKHFQFGSIYNLRSKPVHRIFINNIIFIIVLEFNPGNRKAFIMRQSSPMITSDVTIRTKRDGMCTQTGLCGLYANGTEYIINFHPLSLSIPDDARDDYKSLYWSVNPELDYCNANTNYNFYGYRGISSMFMGMDPAGIYYLGRSDMEIPRVYTEVNEDYPFFRISSFKIIPAVILARHTFYPWKSIKIVPPQGQNQRPKYSLSDIDFRRISEMMDNCNKLPFPSLQDYLTCISIYPDDIPFSSKYSGVPIAHQAGLWPQGYHNIVNDAPRGSAYLDAIMCPMDYLIDKNLLDNNPNMPHFFISSLVPKAKIKYVVRLVYA